MYCFLFSVFPGKESKTLDEIVASVRQDTIGGNGRGTPNTDGNLSSDRGKDSGSCAMFPFTRIVFIDSTWNQCRGIHIDERIAGGPHRRNCTHRCEFSQVLPLPEEDHKDAPAQSIENIDKKGIGFYSVIT